MAFASTTMATTRGVTSRGLVGAQPPYKHSSPPPLENFETTVSTCVSPP